MKADFRNNVDFWAGMMFLGTGAGAMWIARNYPFGTTLNMGPGYFPTLLGGVLVIFGGTIIVRGLRKSEKIQGPWPLRALGMLSLSVVAFGILIEPAGFIPALAALVILSAVAGAGFRVKEVLFLTVFLTLLTVALFIWGLGLPYPLIKLG